MTRTLTQPIQQSEPTLAGRAAIALEEFTMAQASLRASIEFDLKEIEYRDFSGQSPSARLIINNAEHLLDQLAGLTLLLSALRRRLMAQEGGAA